jgi:hypothetical protein
MDGYKLASIERGGREREKEKPYHQENHHQLISYTIFIPPKYIQAAFSSEIINRRIRYKG